MVSNRYLQEIFQISPIPSLLIKANSPQFEMVMANPAFFKTMGVTTSQVIGENVFDVFPINPDTLNTDGMDLLRASFEQVIATGKPHIMERLRYDILNRDLNIFQVRYWEPQNFPLFDEFGNIEHILHLVVDVTEEATSKLQLEATENQYKELLHSLDVIVWEANSDTFQCTYVSPQAKTILGYDPDDWYQTDFWKKKVHPEDRERVLNELKININKLQNHQIEYRMVKADGSEIWLTDRVSVIVDSNRPIKLRGVLTDITQRKNAVRQVQLNERKIRKILDHSVDIICTVDSGGRFKEINAAVENVWGYTPEELLGKIFLDLVHEEDKERSKMEVQNLISGQQTISFENRYITKDGKVVPMLWSSHWDQNEQLLFCVGKDATDLKKAEAKLKYNEQRFKSLVQHGADFIAILDTNGINTYVSPTSKSITGWEIDHLQGYSAFNFMHEDDVDRVKANFQRVIEGESILTETFRIKNKEGKYIWMETYAVNMLDNPVINGIVINARDITEKKKYLEWHEYVNKATNNAIFDWDLEEGLIHWGGNKTLIFKESEDTFKFGFYEYADRFHPEDRERMLSLLRDHLKNRSKNHLKASCQILNPEGIFLDVEIDGFFIRDKSGYVIRMIGAIRDVSIQKRFEQELKISNQRYELVTQATSDVIWDWDVRTNSLFWGEGIEKLFGYDVASLKPNISSWYSRIHPKDYKKVTNEVKRIIASGKSLWEGEYRFLTADGNYNYVYDRGFVVRDNQGEAIRIVGAMQNIHQDKMREVEDNLKLEIGNIFTNTETMDACLKATLKAISKVHEFAFAEIWMTTLDEGSISLRAQYGKGKFIISEGRTRFNKGEGLPGLIWVNNQPKFIEFPHVDEVYVRKGLVKENDFVNIAGFPVFFGDKVKAVIIFFYKRKIVQNRFSPFTQDILGFLGSEIQRKKTEIELDHFFELSPDLMCITDANGTYLKINHAFEVLLGYTKSELISTNFSTLMHPEDMYIFADMGDKVESGQIMNHESRMRNKSGNFIWLSWTAKPFPGDGLIIAVGKDITEKKIQEEALAYSHKETLNILESIQDGFIAIDKEWRVNYWNIAAEKIVQTKREDILDKNIWNVLPSSPELKFFKEFSKVLEDGISVRFDEYYAPLDMWVMVSAYPSETGLTAYLKDITESKIASLKLIQFKKVIENSKDEIAIISTVNDSIYLNPAFTESFGYGSEMLKQIGGPQKIFADEEQAAEVLSDLLSGRHWKGDVELKDQTKTIRSYYISAGPIFDESEKLIAVFVIHTDISKRKETEGKLKSLYSSLQQQAKELNSHRDELKHFAQIASKDLKVPLKNITENLQDFKSIYAEKIDHKGIETLNHALHSSDRMQLLISELLNYTLAGRENGNYDKIDLNEVLIEVIQSLRNEIHAKFAIIEIPKLPILRGNKSHFLQIFKNLISSGLTNHRGKPEIKLEYSYDKTHWLFIIRGIGISSENSEQIFNLFDSLESDENIMNKGIRLAIVRKIINKYKGKIWVETEPDAGSSFHFTISKDI
ncbi:MAG TPA: PAS domain S-box protein [Anditalea sp.]|nr:PAS domain S-box protein [Anditalea sp.]